MLSDELRGIDWDRTPIRNFLDAKPTPKAVAGALIKLGLMSPSEVDDYDWSEIDYSSYPTVRRLLEDYARRTPHSRLEDLLARAGQMLLKKKGGYEVKPAVTTYSNPLMAPFISMEAQGIPLPPPEEVVKELANSATSIQFLEQVEPKLTDYIGKGEKPPAGLLREAMSKAIQYALEALEELGMESEEETLKLKLKAGFTQNPVLRKYYSAKELSRMALKAMEEAGLLKRTTRSIKSKRTTEQRAKTIMTLCIMVDEIRDLTKAELGSEEVLTGLIRMEIPNLYRKIDTNSIKPSYLLQNPTGFLYAVMTNKELACKAIEQNPEKAKTYFREIKELLPLLGLAFRELKMSKNKLEASLMTINFQSKNSPIWNSFAGAIAEAIFEMAQPKRGEYEGENIGLTPPTVEKLTTKKVLEIPPVKKPTATQTPREIQQAKINHYVELLSTFFPNLSKLVTKVIEEYRGNPIIPSPSQVEIPSLVNPTAYIRAMMLKQKAEKNQLSPSLRKELESFGVRIDGQVLLYHGDILHRVEAINIPNYGWVNLKDLGIFLWYDPERGIYYLQTAPGKLKMTTLPQAMRTIARDLNISIPTQTVARNPREEKIMKLLRGVTGTEGGSWRAIGKTERTSTPIMIPIGNLKKELEYIKNYPELIRIVESAPNKEYAIHRLYKMVTAFGPEEVEGCIRFLKEYGYTEEDPEFVQLLDKVCYSKAVTGRYGF